VLRGVASLIHIQRMHHPPPTPVPLVAALPPLSTSPTEPHRSSIAPVFPRARVTPRADQTFTRRRALNSNYGAVFETD
jgi:hypothetical protein